MMWEVFASHLWQREGLNSLQFATCGYLESVRASGEATNGGEGESDSSGDKPGEASRRKQGWKGGGASQGDLGPNLALPLPGCGLGHGTSFETRFFSSVKRAQDKLLPSLKGLFCELSEPVCGNSRPCPYSTGLCSLSDGYDYHHSLSSGCVSGRWSLSQPVCVEAVATSDT